MPELGEKATTCMVEVTVTRSREEGSSQFTGPCGKRQLTVSVEGLGTFKRCGQHHFINEAGEQVHDPYNRKLRELRGRPVKPGDDARVEELRAWYDERDRQIREGEVDENDPGTPPAAKKPRKKAAPKKKAPAKKKK